MQRSFFNMGHEVPVQSMGRERGFQSFAFHPQFAQAGTPGYGRFYTRPTSLPRRVG